MKINCSKTQKEEPLKSPSHPNPLIDMFDRDTDKFLTNLWDLFKTRNLKLFGMSLKPRQILRIKRYLEEQNTTFKDIQND